MLSNSIHKYVTLVAVSNNISSDLDMIKYL